MAKRPYVHPIAKKNCDRFLEQLRMAAAVDELNFQAWLHTNRQELWAEFMASDRIDPNRFFRNKYRHQIGLYLPDCLPNPTLKARS